MAFSRGSSACAWQGALRLPTCVTATFTGSLWNRASSRRPTRLSLTCAVIDRPPANEYPAPATFVVTRRRFGMCTAALITATTFGPVRTSTVVRLTRPEQRCEARPAQWIVTSMPDAVTFSFTTCPTGGVGGGGGGGGGDGLPLGGVKAV